MIGSNFKRLCTAAMISSSIFGATYYWYKQSEVKYLHSGDEKALAYVGKIIEDIQRRPASRLLWQTVATGEALFNGEAIRTPSNGEVRIEFAGSERYIDLEADSLIVLKKSDGDISLDLMEGSLFVNAKGSGTSDGGAGLVLTSDGNKVDLSNASANLSKGKNNSIDLQILEGKASIKDKSGKSTDLKSGDSGAIGLNGITFDGSLLKIISPIPSSQIYRTKDSSDNLSFKWSGFPTGSNITLWVGSSRKNLKSVRTVSSKEPQEIITPLLLGKHFWKLSAANQEGKTIGESSVYRNEILNRLTPAVVFPLVDAKIPIRSDYFDMTFKWQSPPQTASVTIEVWEDANLKTSITKRSFSTEENFLLPSLKKGTYYWRLSANFEGDPNAYIGAIQNFTILKDQPIEKVKIDVSWNMDEESGVQYFIDKPKLDLKWNTPQPDKVSTWRLKVQEENSSDETAISSELKTNFNTQNLEKPGRYIASIEALDKDGTVIGSSLPKNIESAPLPLLPAPSFDTTDLVIKASNDGRSNLQWKEVTGAKEYILSISKNGKELKKSKYSTNTTSLSNLMPGEYEVHLQSVDSYGRVSEKGESKNILVPDKSGLKAPSLKKIKVN